MKQLTLNTKAYRPQETTSFSILIADENEISRLLLKSQLENYSTNITLATDGKTAHTYLQQNQFSLLLLSIDKPDFYGPALIKDIKKTDSINKDTPIIAITTNLQDAQIETLIDAGFNDCLIKPIIMDQLEQKLDPWLPKPIACVAVSSNFDYVSALLKKTSGDKILTTTLFNKLFSELQGQVQIIEKALLSHNLSLALEETHKLHGSVSFCGFTNIQALAKDLEINLSKTNLQLINTNLLTLKRKIFNFIQLKKNILEQLANLKY